MNGKPIFVNACALVNALGQCNADVADGLFRGDRSGMVLDSSSIPHREVYVAAVKDPLPIIPEHMREYDCRNNRLSLAVIQQLETQIERCFVRYSAKRIAIIIGTSTSGIQQGELALAAQQTRAGQLANYRYRQQEIGTPALFIRDYLQTACVAITISTACSSSAKVFASAKRLLDNDLCDVAIVGGVDSLCQLTLNGFSALESVSDGYCNPMSRNRNGLNIGEAASLFIVSREEAEVELWGVGESSDAYHVSAPHPQGLGAEAAMRAALENAVLEPEAISYINLHGTATPKNDAMESLAVQRLFPHQPYCSSTKPLTGHTLGAAGALEVGFCWMTLSSINQEQRLPPHIWDGCVDDDLPQLNLVNVGQGLAFGSGSAVLSNSFAFGGNNASVILGKR